MTMPVLAHDLGGDRAVRRQRPGEDGEEAQRQHHADHRVETPLAPPRWLRGEELGKAAPVLPGQAQLNGLVTVASVPMFHGSTVGFSAYRGVTGAIV